MAVKVDGQLLAIFAELSVSVTFNSNFGTLVHLYESFGNGSVFFSYTNS